MFRYPSQWVPSEWCPYLIGLGLSFPGHLKIKVRQRPSYHLWIVLLNVARNLQILKSTNMHANFENIRALQEQFV